ncbi:MAG: DUF4347 domain-containing protein, partial [Candidatus Methylophosphatis roskildensis]
MRKPAFFRRKPILEELEPRILYSADAQTALLGADDFFHQAEVRTLEPAAAPSANTSVQVEAAEQRSHELVFIDKRVDDYQLLVDDLLSHNDGSRQVEIFLLDPNRDGVAQIGQVLAQRHDISAVHLISHGADGSVQLGSGTLDAATLARDAEAIARWGTSLTQDADLLIYGCDVAEHADGRALISALSRLTGADVAASTNLTGNADLGGDWKLEFQVGQIDFNVAMSEEVQLNWQGQLDTTTGLVGHWTLDANANDSSGNNYNGTLTGNAAIDTNAGTNKVGAGKLTLDGSGDYVDLTAYRANFTSLTQGTIAGWVKTGSAGEGHIFGTDNTAFSSAYTALFVYQNKLNYWVANSGTYLLRAQTTTSVNDNVWHHVAVTVDATGNKLFIDGSQAAVTYTTGNASTQKFLSDVTGVNFMSIGIDKDTSGLNSGLLGLLDDVRVYDRALSAADIAALATTAPILDATKSPTLGAINEDAGAPAGAVGSLVSSLVDFASPAGQVDNVTALGAGGPLGIAVTAADTANGSWYYSINGGTNWNPLGAVANNNARLLAADANTRLYFQPNANYNGTIANAITFRAWDQTSGSNGGTANTTTNGGSTAFSSATDTASLTVNAVNDAPVNSAPTGQYTAYNTPLVFSAGNGNQISVSDVDAGANPLRVTLTVGQGTLTLAATSGLSFSSGANGSATMTFTGTATAINTALNGSTYTPTTSFRGLDTLQIVTNDQGNTGSGGALSDTDTVKLHVGAVVITNTNDLANGTTTSIGALVANDGGDGISLREAILAANNTGGADYIFFNIAGAGVQTINVLTALPTITGAVVIDGWSSPNYTGSPVIELNGGNLGSLVKGVNLGAGSSGSTIRGLIINRFTGTGIEINGGATSNNHTIQGNWIGLNATGTAAAANGNVGIYGLNSTGNLIGGTTAAQRNVISGNAQQGVFFDNVDNSTISGNYIGTNAAGTGDVTGTGSNTLQSGVFLHNGSNGNVVGGTSAGARNVISGNNHYGVEILTSSQNNLVQGNYIGTDVTGQVALGNTNGGMSFWGAGTGNVIGGSAAGAGNVVAANGTGVLVGSASSGATIQGNYIGVAADGLTLLGNTAIGVDIQGNSINTLVGSDNNGTNDAGERNVIAGNSVGVSVADASTTGNAILSNSIYGNTGLGIDLGTTGVTANDTGDGDSGPNRLQNFPVLTTARTDGSTQLIVTGTLNSATNSYYRIEFFANSAQDGSGYGEGQRYLGYANVPTNGSGNATINATISASVTVGEFISATATKSNITYSTFTDTSEFARNIAAVSSTQAVIVVDTASDTADGDTTSLSTLLANKGADGYVSLREAIIAANNTANGTSSDRIVFNIAGAGPHTISVSAAGLPGITDALVIDGTTEPGFAGTPIIELNGTGTNAGADGLNLGIGSDGSTVRGLVINRFADDGIAGAANNVTIAGNYVGTNASGTADLGNAGDGIQADGNNWIIGGTAVADRNLISGNDDDGVQLFGDGNTVLGNYIGTNAAGSAAIGNADEGIEIASTSSGNTIGGTAVGARNVISGNGGEGVLINITTGNQLLGNYIGVDATGTLDLGNAGSGVNIKAGANSNTIGGATPGGMNVISGNNTFGIWLDNGDNNAIQGNRIGTNAAGTAGVANSQQGIAIVNGSDGNLIGGTLAGEGNLVAYNSFDGLAITSGTGNTILGNTFYSNGGTGIDLIDDGVTVNDTGDADTGPNNLQNFPVLTTAATTGTQITITGTFNSTANSYYRIEFFANASQDGTGHGEGQRYLGFANAMTDGSGNATINATISATVGVGEFISATATKSDNTYSTFTDTSEFAQNVVATAPNAAPVLDPAYDLVANPQIEDAGAPVGNVGQGFGADFAAYPGITDADAGDPRGVAIVAADQTHGTWWYSVNLGATWQTLGAVSNTSARLLGANTGALVYFQPDPDYNGTLPAAVTIRAWDQTSGVNGGLADTSVNGGSTAFSSATDTLSFEVTAVNDAPVLSVASSLNPQTEDVFNSIGTLVSTLASGATDVDAGALKGLAITGVDNSHGTWQYTLDGTNWLDIGNVSITSARLLPSDAMARIRFVPNADWNGNTGLTMYKAWDQTSGTAGGLADASVNGGSTAFSFGTSGTALTVSAVNDAPTALAGSVVLAPVPEDSSNPVGATASSLFGGVFSDAADQVTGGSSANAFAGVAIVANAANSSTQGSWQWFDGSSWVDVGTSVSTSSALTLAPTTLLRFVPVADYNGSPGALGVCLIDSSGGAVTSGATLAVGSGGGSSRFSSAANQVSLGTSITAVNDAPAVTTSGGALAYTENQAASAIDVGLTVSDNDSTNLSGATVTISANYVNGQDVLGFTDQLGITGNWNAGAGILTLTGTTTVANYQTALRSVSYANTSDDPGVLARTISVVVSDGGLPSLAATRDIAVSAVNDPPVVFAPAAIAVIEDLPSPIAGIVLYDVDAGGGSVTATFTVSSGTLSAISGGGVVVGGSASALTLTGSISNLNAFIGANALSFTTALDDTSAVTLGVSINDAGNTGSGGPMSSGVTNVTLNVTPVDDTAPAAVADAISVAEGGTATSLVGGATNVKTNDTGLSDTPVNVSLVTDVSHGSLTLNANGTFSYVHDGSENFSDSFSYRLTDNDGETS